MDYTVLVAIGLMESYAWSHLLQLCKQQEDAQLVQGSWHKMTHIVC